MNVEFGKYTIKRSRKFDLFEVEKKGDAFIYRRGDIAKKIVDNVLELGVYPLPPIHLPEKITSFFMVNFSPLVMGGKSRKIIFLKIPAEIGVFVDSLLLDVIGSDEPSFILYGPPTGGYICRNICAEEVNKNGIKPSLEHLYIPLRLKNYTSSALQISRAMINADYLDIYYKGRLALTEMMKLDIREEGIRIRYLNRSYLPNMEKRKALGMILKKEEEIEMRWGP